MQPNDRAAMLSGIRQARQARLDEQAAYLAALQKAREAPESPSPAIELSDHEWELVEKHMAGERWPPTSQDWLRVKGLQWDQHPQHLQLLTIKDKDLQFAVHHYMGIVVQTLRLKAAAHFVSLYGVMSGQAALLFACWQAVALRRELDQMDGAVGGNSPHKSLHADPA